MHHAGSLRTVASIAFLSIMASQDQISQFTPASQMIPSSQPDRSRTPRRPHQDWHQLAPTFRGPMHYAMAASRPMWHNPGPPSPPLHPNTFFTAATIVDTSTPDVFVPTDTTYILPPGPHDRNPFTPQRCCTIQHRNLHRQPQFRQGYPQFAKATPAELAKLSLWTLGNRMSTTTTPTR